MAIAGDLLFMDPNWIAAIAAIVALIFSYLGYQSQRRLEKNKSKSLEMEVAVDHMKNIIQTFAGICESAESEWSDNRSNELKNYSNMLRKSIKKIGYLHPYTGNRLFDWHIEKDLTGNSISYVVDYELGKLGAIVGSKYSSFFIKKSKELRNIQHALLNS